MTRYATPELPFSTTAAPVASPWELAALAAIVLGRDDSARTRHAHGITFALRAPVFALGAALRAHTPAPGPGDDDDDDSDDTEKGGGSGGSIDPDDEDAGDDDEDDDDEDPLWAAGAARRRHGG